MTGLATPMHEQYGPIAIVPPDVGHEMNALESFEAHDQRPSSSPDDKDSGYWTLHEASNAGAAQIHILTDDLERVF